TGQFVTGALFRRERDNPGPLLQVSSDAAEALAMLAGAPTELSVTVLRRQETAPEPVITEPVEATLATPEAISQTALAPVDAAPLPSASDAVVVDLPPATPAAQPASTVGLPPAPLAQIGVFGVRANADSAAARLSAAGLSAAVLPLQNAWRVVAGPVPDAATLTRIKGLGFADAYLIRD
ncbi:MAG: SPOR domain-containing protein, partial [Loktanella sp.]|nr:SPOR domain-containing protein [Loktanella sp.]